jgi:hypothetical protein
MTTPLQIDTLAAVQQLTVPFMKPAYEYLDDFYALDPSERNRAWERVKQDERLLLLFKYFAMPLLGGEIDPKDVPQITLMLDDIVSGSFSDKLIIKCTLLADYLYKKGF